MPTLKPRVALILPPETREAFVALSKALGKPLGATIIELLVEMTPQIRDLARMAAQVKAGKALAAKRTLAHMIGDAAAQIVSAGQPELFAKEKRK